MSNESETPNIEAQNQELKELALKRINQYRNQREEVQEHIKNDPTFPERNKRKDQIFIEEEITRQSLILDEIRPYVNKLKISCPDIFEESRSVAIYLLFRRVEESIGAIFVLLRNGYHYDSMILIRSIAEALDLAGHFILNGEENPDLKKWLEGEIIENEKGRNTAHIFVNQDETLTRPMTDIKKYIYRGLSKYTHLSYAAILDSIDVYAEDYDLNKFVGYYHSRNSSLPLLKSEIDAFIVELRLYYQNINDHIAYKELGELYKKYGEKPNPR